jgi:exonuclease III
MRTTRRVGATTLYHPEARQALAGHRVGLQDTFRLHHAEGGLLLVGLPMPPSDHGLRIDHIFANVPAARLCTAASIDREGAADAAVRPCARDRRVQVFEPADPGPPRRAAAQ